MSTNDTTTFEQPTNTVMAEMVANFKPAEPKSVAVDVSKLATTSAKIRFLNDLGYSRGAIAKVLGIRYQHVRNVLITPVKKAS